jgi:hypothetical protein
MHTFTNEDLTRLLDRQEPPCVSIYFSTEKTYPERHQGPVRYGNLVDRAEEGMRRKYPTAKVQPLHRRLRALVDDSALWTREQSEQSGLAVLASPTLFDTFLLRNPPAERVAVADSFLIRPLLRVAQSADRFHVLCLQRDEVRLYEGNRDGLTLIEPAGVPLTVTAALGEEVTVQRKEQVPGGKSAGEPRPAPRGKNVPPGHPAKGDDAKLDQERFFRAVDRAVWGRVSRESDVPLVLVALPEQQAAFRAVSENPRLLGAGVERSPARATERELLAEVWACVEPMYLARLGQLVEDFNVARARGLATDDLDAAAHAAHAGRVGRMLVVADRSLPGQIDLQTGAVRPADDPVAGDLLDDLAALVLRRKGEVVVVPPERMPTATGLAAVYRF